MFPLYLLLTDVQKSLGKLHDQKVFGFILYHWVAWRINIKKKLINPVRHTLYKCAVILYYYIALEGHRYCKVDTWLKYYYKYPEPQVYPLSLKCFRVNTESSVSASWSVLVMQNAARIFFCYETSKMLLLQPQRSLWLYVYLVTSQLLMILLCTVRVIVMETCLVWPNNR
jgi:hypothetical protein